ncbi:hypothetical protein [Neobacillus massiliamazoniensis]|uniref:Group-specific protein n=1 Tax=Neobacillus massiliamazoniensis TaxID=1499688 RepID=A0A0U1NZ83_9BACI|nr:hypothetical protein [Neobacillus massiliamazoniensis]CRK83331.1 group-specific protein [Neobacillus massiliamazoniensis]
MLKILQKVFALLGLVLAVYALITDRFVVMPYMFFCLGVMLLIMGLQEKRKPLNYLFFLVSGLNIFVIIKTFFFN